MMKSINFRQNGPIESEKCNLMISQLINELNDIIGETSTLLTSYINKEEDIITNIKRRGTL